MNNKVNFLRGTSAEYESSIKDNDTFYYTTDDEKLYLGNKEITGGGVTIDDALSDTSKNPVQNKVITNALNTKANLTDIPTTLPANGGNADTAETIDGKSSADLAYLTNVIGGLRRGWASTNIGTIMTYGDRQVVKTTNDLSYFGWCVNGEGWFFPVIVSQYPNGTKYKIFEFDCGYDSILITDPDKVARFDYKGRTYYACWQNSGSLQHPAVSGGLRLEFANDYISMCKALIDACEAIDSETVDGLHASDFALKTDIPTSLPANGGNADTVNGKHAKEFMSGYTYVVDSDQALLDWANNVGGNDYTHVLVKRGTWTMSQQVAGVNLSQAGTKTVTGEPGSCINIEYGPEDDAHTFELNGLFYEALPEDSDTFIKSLTIHTEQTNTPSGATSSKTRTVNCLKNIKNIINCVCIPGNKYRATNQNWARGMSSCKYIKDSIVVLGQGSAQAGSVNGFKNSSYIQNCIVTSVLESSLTLAYAYNTCKQLSECEATLRSSSSSSVMWGYSNCSYLSNCSSDIDGLGTCIGYMNGNYLSNCKSITNTPSDNNVGFNNTKYVSQCYAETSGAGKVELFYNNSSISNSIAYSKVDSLSKNFIGFSACKGVIGCRGYGVDNSSSYYLPFSGSYASMSANANYVCADTPNGGWNYSDKS